MNKMNDELNVSSIIENMMKKDPDFERFMKDPGLVIFYKIAESHLDQLDRILIDCSGSTEVDGRTYSTPRVTDNCGQNFILRFPTIDALMEEYNKPYEKIKWSLYLKIDGHRMAVHGTADSNAISIVSDDGTGIEADLKCFNL